ncbi:MAG: tetratricopeptide repeat protein [bacterium]
MKFSNYLLLAMCFLLIAGCGSPRRARIPTAPQGVSDEAYIEGLRLLDSAEYDEAIVAFDNTLKGDPWFDPAYIGTSLAYLGKGEYNAARESVEKALDMNKRNPFAYVAQGRILAEQGKFDKALKKFNKAIKVDPLCAEAFFYKGQLYEKQRQYGKAGISYKNALSVDNNFHRASTSWERLQAMEQ